MDEVLSGWFDGVLISFLVIFCSLFGIDGGSMLELFLVIDAYVGVLLFRLKFILALASLKVRCSFVFMNNISFSV